MSFTSLVLVAIALASAPPGETGGSQPVVRIGSKAFTESVILGELMAHLVRSAGGEVLHRDRLGGTRIAFEALAAGEIDMYAEYTGTLIQEVFADRGLNDMPAVRAALAERGIAMSEPLGFNNTYVLGLKKALARKLGVRTISDLRGHADLRFGFSNEFMDRGDGWGALRSRYALPQKDVRGLQHDLAYRGLENDQIDVIDLYATDAEIAYYDLFTLEDDLAYFPDYFAVVLYRKQLAESAPDPLRAVLRLEGNISNTQMVTMNSRSKLDRVPETHVAAEFASANLGIPVAMVRETVWDRILRRTIEHLVLVAVSLAAAVIVAVPLGIVAQRRPRWGSVILGGASVVQTVPSLALLVFMIPLFGLGARSAIAALFLYSLLPIVRNTYAGLHDIPLPIRESADALGLPPGARMWRIELPMATRMILAGIKTSAVINVGTATLGGFIAAGGYGQLIWTGLTRDDTGMILQGAVPAALMALAAQGLFDLAERVLVPRGLRLKPSS